MSKCPHCGMIISGVNINEVTGLVGADSLRTLIYSCPMCMKAISCQIDPIAVRTETVAQVVEEMMRRLGR